MFRITESCYTQSGLSYKVILWFIIIYNCFNLHNVQFQCIASPLHSVYVHERYCTTAASTLD